MGDTDSAFPGLLPEAFLNRMQELLTEEEYAAFLSSYGQKRRFSLRLNPLKADCKKAFYLLHNAAAGPADRGAEDIEQAVPETEKLRPVPWEPDGFYYPEDFRPGRLPWHEAGMYYIQEASAMAPAVLCGAKPGERILDLCAAPGGKSTKLAACLKGEGILVANEIHPERAKILSSNLERMGVRNALVTNEPPQRLASRFPLYFDRIVVDAPCSGEGMFRKEEEALVHWSPENVRMCADRQTEILEEAASMLRPGGYLVYSTCTFSPEENEGTIYRFLQTHPDFAVINIPDLPGVRAKEWGFSAGRPEWIPKVCGEAAGNMSAIGGTIRLWPYLLDGEGHFAAVLQKADNDRPADDSAQESFSRTIGLCVCAESKNAVFPGAETAGEKRHGKKGLSAKKNRAGKKAGKKDPKKEEALKLWKDFCSENLSIPASGLTGEEKLLLFGETLYAMPVPLDSLSLTGLRVLRPGLQLGSITRGRFVPAHALGMTLCPEEVMRAVQLRGDSPEAYAWFRGEAVPLTGEFEKGWCVIYIDGCAAGWGKAAGNMIKNHYPKGLRKSSSYRSG